MNLVSYSDSEGSDRDSDPAPKPSKSASKTAPKAAPKLVDPGTNKVKVNLSSLTSGNDADAAQDARPAKRQRTGGGLNIDAFLPPPKQPAKQLSNESSFAAKKAAGKGLGRGVNLKTGAEPAFTRSETTTNLELDGEPKNIKEVIAELRRSRLPQNESAGTASPIAMDAVPTSDSSAKLVGNAMRFKPKSVAWGPVKKRAVVTPTASQVSNSPQPAPTAAPTSSETATAKPSRAQVPAAPKAKVSLFSIGVNDTAANAPSTEEDVEMAEVPDEAFDSHDQPDASSHRVPTQAAPSASAVDGLNLSAAEMRQLFGRKAGKGQMPDMDSLKMVNFNADDQYAANEVIRARGESVQHNPVRGLAPGKHSLKQLVNAAATQADALEEHFAQGKRNQREAGSKYGW